MLHLRPNSSPLAPPPALDSGVEFGEEFVLVGIRIGEDVVGGIPTTRRGRGDARTRGTRRSRSPEQRLPHHVGRGRRGSVRRSLQKIRKVKSREIFTL